LRAWHGFRQGKKCGHCQGNAGAKLAACGRYQSWQIRHVFLIETASNGITNGGQQTGRYGGVLAPRTGVWIGIVVKSSLVVGQKGDTQEANDQACHAPTGKPVSKPQPGNQGCK